VLHPELLVERDALSECHERPTTRVQVSAPRGCAALELLRREGGRVECVHFAAQALELIEHELGRAALGSCCLRHVAVGVEGGRCEGFDAAIRVL